MSGGRIPAATRQAVLSLTQVFAPLLRKSTAARIVKVSSGLGALNFNSTPNPYGGTSNRLWRSKTALNAIPLAFTVDLDAEGLKIDAVPPVLRQHHVHHFRRHRNGRAKRRRGGPRHAAGQRWSEQTVAGTVNEWFLQRTAGGSGPFNLPSTARSPPKSRNCARWQEFLWIDGSIWEQGATMSNRLNVDSIFRRRPTAFESVATFAIIAALLYLGAGILVPLTLAVLLAFALNPVVSVLNRRLRLPDPIAVIVAVALALILLAGFAAITGSQIANLAAELPGYQQTVMAKVEALQTQFGGFVWLDELNSTIANLGQSMESSSNNSYENAPIPVTISNELGPLTLLASVMGSVLGPIATIAIVSVFLIFLLIGRSDLQDRFIRLVSAGKYSLTNLAISDASERVGRYLIVQLMVNTIYGAIFGVGLWLIGVPSAALWGMLIVLFRYIPFVGALIIAVVPFTLAFAVDPGWNMFLMSLGLFLVLDLTTANVIEPRLYGSSTGVSPLAILLSAMFWATLWGPVGLILSTPMTVCLVVIGRHLPQFQFLETLLGSAPVLAPAERLYQRMLNGDSEDAIEISEDHVEEFGKRQFISELMLPALRMANAELQTGPEAVPQRRQLMRSFETVLDGTLAPRWSEAASVLLIGGRSEIDEAAAQLLGAAISEAGAPVDVLPPGAIRQEAIGRLDLTSVEVLVLVFIGDDLRAQCRYVARRVRRMAPDVRIVACILNERANHETAETLHIDYVAHDFPTAAEIATQDTSTKHTTDGQPTVNPFSGGGRGSDALGRALDAIAERFKVPAAIINLVDDHRHLEDEEAARLTLIVAEGNQPLVIRSDQPNALVGDNAYLQTNGIDLYAGAPLTLPDGTCPAVLCLIDYEPHQFSQSDVQALMTAANELVSKFGTTSARNALAGRPFADVRDHRVVTTPS
ncbi:AI-2E family transporter [Devosia sp. LjRoot3]|uniref:AI-2E family transporter n=1 Tax=Devosia sp. LjRoot3 TaxID=3342319 RepID=UPI003ED04B88